MSDVSKDRQTKYDRFEQLIDPWMLGLSIVFVLVFVVGFLPDLPESVRVACEWVGWFIWWVFAGEFVTRFVLAPDRKRMLQTHAFDLLVLVLPALRIFRGFRVIRGLLRAVVAIGGITVSGRALDRTRRLVRSRGVPYVLGLVILSTLAGSLIIYQVEAGSAERNILSIGDALWWAVSTVTTVGYGDRYPTTTEGRVVAFALMLLGLGLFSLVTARVAAFFLGDEQSSDETRESLDALHQRLSRMEDMLRESRVPAAELKGALERSRGGPESLAD